MKIIKQNKSKKKNKILDEQIGLIVDYLKRGKVIIYPTDTIYGLGCVATDKKAIDRIYKIKKRNKKKSLLILVSSLAMAKRYCYASQKQKEYLRKVWRITPQPPFRRGAKKAVSVILRNRGVLPRELTGGGDSIAVRLPNSEFLVKIIRQVNVPIVSTSLNISGRKNLTNVGEIRQYFKFSQPPLSRGRKKSPQHPFIKGGNNRYPNVCGGHDEELPDLVVDAGEIRAKPSKLIDLRDINNILVIRN